MINLTKKEVANLTGLDIKNIKDYSIIDGKLILITFSGEKLEFTFNDNLIANLQNEELVISDNPEDYANAYGYNEKEVNIQAVDLSNNSSNSLGNDSNILSIVVGAGIVGGLAMGFKGKSDSDNNTVTDSNNTATDSNNTATGSNDTKADSSTQILKVVLKENLVSQKDTWYGNVSLLTTGDDKYLKHEGSRTFNIRYLLDKDKVKAAIAIPDIDIFESTVLKDSIFKFSAFYNKTVEEQAENQPNNNAIIASSKTTILGDSGNGLDSTNIHLSELFQEINSVYVDSDGNTLKYYDNNKELKEINSLYLKNKTFIPVIDKSGQRNEDVSFKLSNDNSKISIGSKVYEKKYKIEFSINNVLENDLSALSERSIQATLEYDLNSIKQITSKEIDDLTKDFETVIAKKFETVTAKKNEDEKIISQNLEYINKQKDFYEKEKEFKIKESKLNISQFKFNQAKDKLANKEKLFEKLVNEYKQTSQTEYLKKAEAALETAKKALETAKKALKKAETDLETAKTALGEIQYTSEQLSLKKQLDIYIKFFQQKLDIYMKSFQQKQEDLLEIEKIEEIQKDTSILDYYSNAIKIIPIHYTNGNYSGATFIFESSKKESLKSITSIIVKFTLKDSEKIYTTEALVGNLKDMNISYNEISVDQISDSKQHVYRYNYTSSPSEALKDISSILIEVNYKLDGKFLKKEEAYSPSSFSLENASKSLVVEDGVSTVDYDGKDIDLKNNPWNKWKEQEHYKQTLSQARGGMMMKASLNEQEDYSSDIDMKEQEQKDKSQINHNKLLVQKNSSQHLESFKKAFIDLNDDNLILNKKHTEQEHNKLMQIMKETSDVNHSHSNYDNLNNPYSESLLNDIKKEQTLDEVYSLPII